MKKTKALPLVLAASVLFSCLVYYLCYRLDNRYTQPRPYAADGVTELDMSWYDNHPLFYLADGWTFYQGALLTPDEAAARAPDATLYLGQYGGFDLGDPTADPHGAATYRAVIRLDGRPRQFALELTEIHSRWRLWVNGELMQSVRMGDPNAPAPDSRLITFTAADQIEIVVQVADETGFYSGMVTPPALGSPEAVGRVSSARLALHSLFCGAALLQALLCLLLGASRGARPPYLALTLLCVCFAGSSAWPLAQALGLQGAAFSLLRRLCYYGVFPALLWVQGGLCRPPKRALYPALAAGGLLCLGVLLQPLFPVQSAAPLFWWSRVLGVWKWLAAVWLLATAVYALRRGARGSAALLAGGCVFAAALVMDRLLPLHEPILLGWFVEIAGGLLILLYTALIWGDTIQVYREEAALRAQKQLAETQLAARAAHARLQRGYVERARRDLHETRSRLTLIRHYLDEGALDELRAYLDSLTPASGPSAGTYTGNSLMDAILSIELEQARAHDTYAGLELCPLPETLPIRDDDLTSLLINLLDNAVEAAARLPDPSDRWLSLSCDTEGGALVLRCVNAAPPPDAGRTSKADLTAHGFGLSILRETAEKYGGTFTWERDAEGFLAVLSLPLPPGAMSPRK